MMPSKSRQTLTDNKDDLDRLLELHANEAGSTPGRKFDVEVLNKASVVLVCAAWEAYCEDIVKEAIEHIATDCSDVKNLPDVLKTKVAEKIRIDKNQQAPWALAGEGWKAEVKAHSYEAIGNLTGHWNTPKSAPIRTLFEKSLGIKDITKTWYWQKNTVETTMKRLDDFVTLRCEIAHRLNPKESVRKKDATEFYDLACRIADCIDKEVHTVLGKATGRTYW